MEADMLSLPPAKTISASPAFITWAASETALRPEPQTIFIVTAGHSFGIPEPKTICLATFCPCPACKTFPM